MSENDKIAGLDVATAKIIALVGTVALVSYEVLVDLFLPDIPDPSPLRLLLIVYTFSFAVFLYWRTDLARRYAMAFKAIPWSLTADSVYRVYVSSFSFDTAIPLILVIFCCAMLAENRRELCGYLLLAMLGVTVCGALVVHPETPLLSYNFTMIVMSAVMFILIGARLQDQAELAEKEKILERTEQIAGIGGWDYYPHQRTFHCTKAMLGMLDGPSDGKFAAGELLARFSPDDGERIEARIQTCLQTGRRIEWEVELEAGSGQSRWIRTIIDRIGDGRNQHIAGTSQDVSVFKRTEMEIVQSKGLLELANADLEANREQLERRVQERTADLNKAKEQAEAASRAKSEFLATMSHEIRTPMNGVLGMTELLCNTRLTHQQEQFAQTIYESAGSLLGIIDDILDLSKLEAGKLTLESTPIDLCLLVEESVESLAEQAQKKGLELIVDLPAGFRTLVRSDPVRLRQVLTNLVGNAIKFTELGEVVVRLTETEVGSRRRQVQFEVIDTGIGIAPEQQGSIFDSFTQADGTTTRLYGGTGLGLAISQQIVELMGGSLRVESQPGTGSRFFFSLRLEAVARPATTPGGQGQVAGSRALVVDDNPTNREILDRHLSGWRVDTRCAASAAEAMQILTDCDPATPFELAILDMHMPGADGLELAAAIRRNPEYAAMKIIFLSSMATVASAEQVRLLNITGQLTKPVRQAQLYDALLAATGGTPEPGRRGAPGAVLSHSLSGHVLLVEDNVVNQAVGTGMLESIGLEVTVASNGLEAVARVRESRFDAILMDCQMPLLDGFEATCRIRKLEAELHLPRNKIVAVTANALKGDLERCLDAGMDEYLSKPFTKAQLHAVLVMCLPRQAKQVNPGEPAGQSKPAAAPAIDRSVINLLASMQEPGSPDIVERVVKLYVESSGELKSALRQAIDTADAELLREASHSLKSSSANIGATRIADLCARLEVMGRESQLDEATRIYGLFEEEYERAIESLAEIHAA
ncbi:MAG: response regulator [Pseudomonadota bacterium]